MPLRSVPVIVCAALALGPSAAPAAQPPAARDLDPGLALLRHRVLATRTETGWELTFLGVPPKDASAAIALIPTLSPTEESVTTAAGGVAIGMTPMLVPPIAILDTGTLTDAHLGELARFPQVREVSLSLNANVTDDGLAKLKAAPGLTGLALDFCAGVTRAGIKHIGNMPGLTRLSLSGVLLVEDDWPNPIAGLPRLVRLQLTGCLIGDTQLARLGALGTLKELSLARNSRLTPGGLSGLAKLAKLESLDLTGLPVADKDLPVLAQWPKLTRLILRETKITDAGLTHIGKLRTLHHLDLGHTTITGTGFAQLAGLTELESLGLSGAAITGAGFEHLGKLPKLRTLGLRRLPAYTGVGLDHLAGCKELTALDLSQTGVGDDGLSRVRRVAQLKVLVLPDYVPRNRTAPDDPAHAQPVRLTDDGRLTDAGLGHVAALARLEELTVSGKAITDAGLGALARLRALRKLTLGPVPGVRGQGLEALKAVTTLTDLNLTESGLLDAAMRHVAVLASVTRLWLPKAATDAAIGPLKGMSGLRTVYHGIGVTERGAGVLREALPDVAVLRMYRE